MTRLTSDEPKEVADAAGPAGSGSPLGDIDSIADQIGKTKDPVAKELHKICYGKPGKQTTRKKMLRAFNGWADESAAETKADKLAGNTKIKVSILKEICSVLGLEKSGTKEEIATRMTEFLAKPSSDMVKGGGTVSKKRKAKGTKSSTKAAAKGKKAKKEVKKKRAPSAYMLFSQDTRTKVVADNPDMSFGDIGRELGKLWKAATEKVKAKYQKKAAGLKAAKEAEEPEKEAEAEPEADGAAAEEEDDEEEEEAE